MRGLWVVILVVLAGWLWIAGPALAQEMPSQAPSIPLVDNPAPASAASSGMAEYTPVPGQPTDGPKVYYTFHTPFEFYLTLLIVGILAVTLAVLGFMARSSGMTQDFTRTFVIVVIVFAALFLISAGYSDQQAAPVYGLLGTIAGYIFGRMPQEDEKDKKDKTEEATATPGEPQEKPI